VRGSKRIVPRCSIRIRSHEKENAMPLLTEGSPAPAFSVPNQDGTTKSLGQFAGKWLVLWWYPKADTPG
jgi:peroxiredoxin